jgi:hypothetical protein
MMTNGASRGVPRGVLRLRSAARQWRPALESQCVARRMSVEASSPEPTAIITVKTP